MSSHTGISNKLGIPLGADMAMVHAAKRAPAHERAWIVNRSTPVVMHLPVLRGKELWDRVEPPHPGHRIVNMSTRRCDHVPTMLRACYMQCDDIGYEGQPVCGPLRMLPPLPCIHLDALFDTAHVAMAEAWLEDETGEVVWSAGNRPVDEDEWRRSRALLDAADQRQARLASSLPPWTDKGPDGRANLPTPPVDPDWEWTGVEKVVSGGQTGADQAGLRAAASLGIQTGGWAAPGYGTSQGACPEMLSAMGLVPVETRGAAGLVQRTKWNVRDSNATIAFREHASPGTDKTIGLCMTGKWKVAPPDGTTYAPYRPVLVVWRLSAMEPGTPEWAKQLLRAHIFLSELRVRVLNVAGHRQSNKLPGWNNKVKSFMRAALQTIPPPPPPEEGEQHGGGTA